MIRRSTTYRKVDCWKLIFESIHTLISEHFLGVCMYYVCMYTYVYTCMYIYTYISHGTMCVCVSLCVCVCVCVHIYIYIHIHIYIHTYIYICIYIWYMYIYIYVYTYIYMYIWTSWFVRKRSGDGQRRRWSAAGITRSISLSISEVRKTCHKNECLCRDLWQRRHHVLP